MMTLSPFLLRFRSGLLIAGALLVGYAWLALLCQAQSTPDALAGYEQRLYSHSYQGESTRNRLDRLETSVFGEARTGSDNERQNRLMQVLGVIHSNPTPAPPDNTPSGGVSTFSSAASPSTGENNPAPVIAQPPDATDYPTVTALEREVFSRDFIHDNVSHRLTRLEARVFGQSYPQVALVDRVDKLLARYPNVSAQSAQTDNSAVSPAIRGLPSNSNQFAGSSRDVYTKVAELERASFHAPASSGALLTERLDRLESKAYGRTYSGESIDARVNRLISSHQVRTSVGRQPRPPFQSRRLYQPSLESAPQYYNPPATSAYSTQTAPPPQNIQIGGGFSENSSYHFSPEMMSMLPPEVRNQLGAGQTGTVVSAPGTVVMQQSSSSGYPSGFQTYGGAPIQHYNYYGSPATSMQSQTTTTVIQPNGGTAVYGYPGASAVPGNLNGLPNPAYVGDPNFLQTLNNLEINLYGQVNMVEPVYIRLGRLESTMLGQVYPNYPQEQRLANLQKAYQLQSIGKLLGKGKAANFGRTAGSALLGIPLNTPAPITLPPPTPPTQ